MLHRARVAARRVGLDFTRYPPGSPDYQAFRAFTSSGPDVILDVGANDGGFATQCRRAGFDGEILWSGGPVVEGGPARSLRWVSGYGDCQEGA